MWSSCDSTGLKVYGKDEWHQEKHAVPARRTWRKLHLATDEHHHILACELTTPEVVDRTATADLLAQIATQFDAFIGEGAYDGEPVSQVVFDRKSDALVIVPPHKTAVVSSTGDTQRDQHIKDIADKGRITLSCAVIRGLGHTRQFAQQERPTAQPIESTVVSTIAIAREHAHEGGTYDVDKHPSGLEVRSRFHISADVI